MRKYTRKTESAERQDVEWKQPAARSMPVYEHHCTCEYCGRAFVAESLSPLKPRFCVKADPEGCFKRRSAEYMKLRRRAEKEAES